MRMTLRHASYRAAALATVLAPLNYCFANLVWLIQEEGVNLGAPGTATL